jgi:GNAT superfamily N-acetyltransferase
MQDEQPLTMVRENLEGIPHFAIPATYAFRWYRPGDEEHWIAIQAPFYEAGAISVELFREQFGADPGVLGERQCYLLDASGQPIGTATAWVYDGFRTPGYGRIHWVAIAPPYQGQGLSKALMTIVCSRMRDLGHTAAYLTTSWTRPVAIRLYRAFGFVELVEP